MMGIDPVREQEQLQLTKLLAKLVLRAICDVVNYRNSCDDDRKAIHDAAYRWMYVENGYDSELVEDDKEKEQSLRKYDQLMSFENICDTLGWDPDWVRERTKTLTKRQLRRVIKNNGLT